MEDNPYSVLLLLGRDIFYLSEDAKTDSLLFELTRCDGETPGEAKVPVDCGGITANTAPHTVRRCHNTGCETAAAEGRIACRADQRPQELARSFCAAVGAQAWRRSDRRFCEGQNDENRDLGVAEAGYD